MGKLRKVVPSSQSELQAAFLSDFVSPQNGLGQFSQQVALSFSGDPQAYGASGTPPTPDVPPQSDIGEYRVDWDAEDTQVKPVPAQMGSTSGTPAGPATTAGPATPVLPKMPAKGKLPAGVFHRRRNQRVRVVGCVRDHFSIVS
ncbi:MAG: hypothetical protein BJ554DRAFT_6251 [Olpidium bornovanus]|uniref:Uncharacterized protein n=1 Tax=Olpidium bornovanus TaxID=278681 RepID=A0A8H8A273_9FUNG|nr:MAG: hypothetical protein BJ554DRAFT_6251 [Olpidium bornovanus]